MEIKAKINKWDLIKLKSFHVLAIINSAVMNIGVHVSLSILVSLVCMPKQWDCWIIRQFYFQMTQRDGMGREEGSGWGTHVYLWQIHFDILQNQYNIVKLKN